MGGGGKLTVLLVAVVTSATLPFVANATTYYLSPSGNDSNDGKSESAAFKTVNKAFSAVHSQGTKDELIILTGEYAATSTLSMSGQSSSNFDDADVIRSSTRNPADVIIYGDGTFNLLNLARGVVVDGITFSNGVAKAAGIGGGARVGSNTAEYTTIITNCVITHCSADCAAKAGGGAYVYGAGKILDCVIENCSATTDDGAAGVFLNNSSKTPTIEHTIIRNCSGLNYSDNKTCAGGIASYGTKTGSERIVDCVISNCTTTVKGGGAYLDLGPSAFVSGTTFSQCHAVRGGGVLVMGGTGEFENCSFVENSTAVGDNGGGVLVASSSRVSFKDCCFNGNVAGNGGALYMTSTSSASLSNCDFTTNNADDGGALYMTSTSSASLSNCTFTANNAGYGGAAAFKQDAGSYFTFTNCLFASNIATNFGGAVSCSSANYPKGSDSDELTTYGMYGEIYGCVFTNNSANSCGGGLFLRDRNGSKARNSGTPLVLRNSLFAYNSVKTSGGYHCGGGIYLLSYDKPVVDSCTIACNDVTSAGGNQFGAGFYNRWSCSITNTIIACNTMNGVSEGANDWIRGSSTVTASHSCVYPAPAPGSGASNPFTAAKKCISVDPKFADAANGDFRLKGSSPCKNTGILEDWMANAFDLSGNVRVLDDVPNMGCYEFYPLPGLMLIFR